MNRPTRAMFIGTCRMHDPVKALAGDTRVYARSTPHRFHTTGQTLQFVQHMNGSVPYRTDMLHLISDYAAAEILGSAVARQTVLDRFEGLRKLWASFEVFVIEISTRREFSGMLGGKPVTVNTFAARDQQLHQAAVQQQAAAAISVPPIEITSQNATSGRLLRDMQAIKRALGGRPVIWVSHMRPTSDDPQYASLITARAEIALFLQTNATTLGDQFIDPSDTAATMGQTAFFAKDGRDLDHMTPAAAQLMAEIYAHRVLQLSGKA